MRMDMMSPGTMFSRMSHLFSKLDEVLQIKNSLHISSVVVLQNSFSKKGGMVGFTGMLQSYWV